MISFSMNISEFSDLAQKLKPRALRSLFFFLFSKSTEVKEIELNEAHLHCRQYSLPAFAHHRRKGIRDLEDKNHCTRQ